MYLYELRIISRIVIFQQNFLFSVRVRTRARRRAFFYKADGCWHAHASSVVRCSRSLALFIVVAHMQSRRHDDDDDDDTCTRTRMPDTYMTGAHAVRDSINKYVFAVLSNLPWKSALRFCGQRAISATRKSLRNAYPDNSCSHSRSICSETRWEARKSERECADRIASPRRRNFIPRKIDIRLERRFQREDDKLIARSNLKSTSYMSYPLATLSRPRLNDDRDQCIYRS